MDPIAHARPSLGKSVKSPNVEINSVSSQSHDGVSREFAALDNCDLELTPRRDEYLEATCPPFAGIDPDDPRVLGSHRYSPSLSCQEPA